MLNIASTKLSKVSHAVLLLAAVVEKVPLHLLEQSEVQVCTETVCNRRQHECFWG